ncbi:MAG: ABC transporter substrate-binding protein [Alphaproteobacteria bacterium]|jgi:phospholipid transport system substrate-binding protein
MQRRAFLVSAIATGLFGATTLPSRAAEAYVDASAAFIRDLSHKAITTLSNPDLSTEDRRAKFRDLFNDSFAVQGIALYVLGRYRRRATKEELNEYLSLFEDVIVNTWADRFTEYAGQKFEVKGAAAIASGSDKEKAAIVQSTFFTDPNTLVDIEWRVNTNGKVYKITDVKVAGLSLAKTQQDEFGSVIRANGNKVSALIDKLRQMRNS